MIALPHIVKDGEGETTLDGLKWNIVIKKDELDEFWFDYQYYGASDEIEYTIYQYKVIDDFTSLFNY